VIGKKLIIGPGYFYCIVLYCVCEAMGADEFDSSLVVFIDGSEGQWMEAHSNEKLSE
jgi:hypothetical protein